MYNKEQRDGRFCITTKISLFLSNSKALKLMTCSNSKEMEGSVGFEAFGAGNTFLVSAISGTR